MGSFDDNDKNDNVVGLDDNDDCGNGSENLQHIGLGPSRCRPAGETAGQLCCNDRGNEKYFEEMRNTFF